ncbi:fimbrial protein pilA [Sorangium cellulosum]|uniref:Fimbrial protein pilA n=1 Tax=Sorangium cellulosum TaxID=56 RepID=A0A2L0EX09_SORCE|nr:prepilin-type N-terminal cleavage/methylation domain-containing protein [Sorangium cellulosum]AUX43838.1 fimbrial protein pilA [Sorangium cellulosum]
MRIRQRRRYAAGRGFTLVELLVVVAMVGILAALGLVGYRKYMAAAGTGEPKAIMQAIRGAQESYKAEMLVYLDCSGTLDDWYPSADLGDHKHSWNAVHHDADEWRMLNVATDGAVKFGYAVVAGVGTGFPTNTGTTYTWAGLPAPPLSDPQFAPNGPWYVIQAAGDRDQDGTLALLLTTSTMSGIYWENDTE